MINIRSLGTKIMIGGGLAGLLALLCMGAFSIYKMEKAIQEENIQGVNKLTFGVVNGLENIMLSGDSELARNLANRLKNMEDVESFKILRLDGQEAFVEGREPDERENQDGEESEWVGFTRFDPSKVDADFARTVQTETAVIVSHKGDGGEAQQTFFVPILNKEPCQACHGDGHSVRGVLKITVSIENMIQNVIDTRIDLILMLIASITIFMILLRISLQKLVIIPVNEVKEKMREFAEGEYPDLTQKIQFSSQDEIGELVHWFNRFLGIVGEIISNAKQSAVTLDLLAKKLRQASEHMGDGIDEVNDQAQSSSEKAQEMKEDMEQVSRVTMGAVAILESSVEKVVNVNESMVTISSASEEANVNLRHVADKYQEISMNMESVRESTARSNANFNAIASAIEALGQSFQEVGNNCEKAQEDSAQAVRLSENTSLIVENLADAASKIYSIVNEISDIANQTNMLALNASIEAAGAGQAGLGFSVVANEVKQLASRTAHATDDITNDIKGVQDRIKEAIDATGEVSKMIGMVGSINREITHSVDEQNNALNEINKIIALSVEDMAHVTENINNSSAGIAETARNADEISSGINEVTQNVAVISHNMEEVSEAVRHGTQQGMKSAETVVEVARSTQQIVEAMETSVHSAQGIQALSLSVQQQAKTLADLGKTLNEQLSRFQV
ncbi:MAG: methyl-accepting chemotaxis protein [Magnetococcales bacterium]|nr:methyl-accepting chemotaxis protein [Magnetococcales bacterium]